MDTTGTYNPLKLRWHALTWKPTANGELPTKQRNASQQQIWSTNPHIKSNFLPLGKHDFVTNEIRTLPKTHRKKKTAATLRRRRAFITSHVRSTNKDVSELVLHVQSWPRAARRWTRGTARDDTNDAREHHNMTSVWRAGHCDNRLPNRHGETPRRIPTKHHG